MDILTKYKNKFKELVQGYDYDETNFDGRLCPDQFVGKICELGKICEPYQRKKYYIRLKKNNIFDYSQEELQINGELDLPDNILLLILESPHIAEFFFQKSKKVFGNHRKNPAPAMGKYHRDTGYNIVSPLGNTFFTYTESIKKRHLILFNAIPFQCSLGVDTGTFRDKVFTEAWKNELIGQNFFKERLEFLLKKLKGKDVVIVNACTKDKEEKKKNKDDKENKGRKHSVTDSIIYVIEKYKPQKTELWEAPHPSSLWWFVEKCWKRVYPTRS